MSSPSPFDDLGSISRQIEEIEDERPGENSHNRRVRLTEAVRRQSQHASSGDGEQVPTLSVSSITASEPAPDATAIHSVETASEEVDTAVEDLEETAIPLSQHNTDRTIRDIPPGVLRPVILRLNKDKSTDVGTMGHTHRHAGRYLIELHMDFGRYARPALDFCIRIAKSDRGIDKEDRTSYFEYTFTYHPGVEHQRGNKRATVWQIEELSGRLLSRSARRLQELGIVVDEAASSNSNRSKAAQEYMGHQDNTWVINFKGRGAIILRDSEKDATYSELLTHLNNSEDTRLRNMVKSLWRGASVDLTTFFFVQREKDRKNWTVPQMEKGWTAFENAVDRRLKPLHCYYNAQGEINVHVGMEKVDSFYDGIYATYIKEKVAGIDKQIELNTPVGKLPASDDTYRMPAVIHFTSREEQEIVLKLCVVRAEQNERAAVQKFEGTVEIAAVKGYRSPDDHDSGDEHNDDDEEENIEIRLMGEEHLMAQNLMYFVVYLPQDMNEKPGRTKTPPLNSLFKVEISEHSHDDQKVNQARTLHVCRVVEMTAKEKQESEGHFMLATVRSKKSRTIQAAGGFSSLDQQERRQATLVPIFHADVIERKLGAVSDFCSSNEYLDLSLPWCFGPEKVPQAPIDISKGPGNCMDSTACTARMWKSAIVLLRLCFPKLEPDQEAILTQAPENIERRILLIEGGPGCAKTYTTTLLMLLCIIVDHKVLIEAKHVSGVDNIMTSLEERRQEFCNRIEELLDEFNEDHQERQSTEHGIEGSLHEPSTATDSNDKSQAHVEGDEEIDKEAGESDETSKEYREALEDSEYIYSKLVNAKMYRHTVHKYEVELAIKACFPPGETDQKYDLDDIFCNNKGYNLIGYGTDARKVQINAERRDMKKELKARVTEFDTRIQEFNNVVQAPDTTDDVRQANDEDFNAWCERERGEIDELANGILERTQALPMIKADWERVPGLSTKPIKFPINHHLPYQLLEIWSRVASEDLQSDEKRIASYVTAYHDAMTSLQSTDNGDQETMNGHKANARQALELAIGTLISQQSVVACTYDYACSSEIATWYNPDIVVHEDVYNIDVSTAAYGFAKPSAKAHVVLSDPQRIAPRDTPAQAIEVYDFTRVSFSDTLRRVGPEPWELKKCFRSHASILRFVNDEFYDGELKYADSLEMKHPTAEIFRSAMHEIYWEQRQVRFEEYYYLVNSNKGLWMPDPVGNKTENHGEAKIVLRLVKKFVEKGIPTYRITILCPYRSQLGLIGTMLDSEGLKDITLNTIDQYREPSDFVILATTATAFEKERRDRKLNVQKELNSFVRSGSWLLTALSRARYGLVAVGSFHTLLPACVRKFKTKNDQKKAKKSFMPLHNFIVDAIKREIMIYDDTEDPNHVDILDYDDYRAQSSDGNAWIERWEGRPCGHRSHVEAPREVATRAGPGEGTATGPFPAYMKDLILSRTQAAGNVRRWKAATEDQGQSS